MFKCVQPSVNDFVKVAEGRGCPGIWRVAKVDRREAEIVSLDGKAKERFFVTFLYKDGDTLRAQRDWRIARADKIGRK